MIGLFHHNEFLLQLPFQSYPGGLIDVNLFKGIMDNWETRQTLNNVAIHMSSTIAIDSIFADTWTDQQSVIQYFTNPNSGKRIVVFGHTHKPKIFAALSYDNKKCIYANSGTWIDFNENRAVMTFIVITPQSSDVSSKTCVKLYNFMHEVVSLMAVDELRY